MNKNFLNIKSIIRYLKLFKQKLQKVKRLDYIEIHLCDHCNLNCAYCSHFCSVAEPTFYDIKDFEKDIERLAELTNNDIPLIKLLGGEPLLNENCNEYFDITHKFFPNSSIILVTNGILLKSQNEKFWESAKNNNITIECSQYPINLDYLEIKKIVEDKNVKFIFNLPAHIKKQYFTKFALSRKKKLSLFESYFTCFLDRTSFFFKEGKIYHCPIVGNISHLNKYFNTNFEISEKDFIDIYKASNLKEILNFLSFGTPFCRYCSSLKHQREQWKKSQRDLSEWCID